jgi:hypothetical protein
VTTITSRGLSTSELETATCENTFKNRLGIIQECERPAVVAIGGELELTMCARCALETEKRLASKASSQWAER